MKQPLGIAPITVPSVSAAFTDADEAVLQVLVDHLVTIAGPAESLGRHAWLLLTRNQAEVLVHELSAKLGITITSTL